MEYPTESVDRAEFVRRAVGGEHDAFDELVRSFHERLYRFVYFRTGSESDAWDLTQDIWMRAFDKLHGLKNPASFNPWLFRMAANRVKDFLRRKRIRKLVGFGELGNETDRPEERIRDRAPDGFDKLVRKEFRQTTEHMFAFFSKKEKEVFRMRHFDQLSIREISEILRSSESGVKTHLHRALDKAGKSGLLEEFREGGIP